MIYDEKIRKADLAHQIIMEGRERMSVSGVEDVESFDENAVVMYTSRGVLIVKGEGLHIEKLSLDTGELNIEGKVEAMQYDDDKPERQGFWSRLFK